MYHALLIIIISSMCNFFSGHGSYKYGWMHFLLPASANNLISCMFITWIVYTQDLYQEQDAQIKKPLGDLNAEEEAVSVCQILHSMQLTLSDTQVDLNLILLLGHLRFILNKCTDIIQTTLGGSCNPCLTAEVRDLLMAIMRLCQHTNNDWPK